MTGADAIGGQGLRAADVLGRYPKTRPALSAAHEAVYVREYKLNRDGGGVVEGLAKRLEAWMHRQIAERAGPGPTLEVGAGTLTHLRFEPPAADYDIVEPFTALYAASPARARVRAVFDTLGQIEAVPTYRRIISVAVLEHMVDLPRELARCGLLLLPEGEFRAGIPSEGGLLWGTTWRCTTGVSYRLRNGLDYGTLMRHEHVNAASEILCLVRHFFGRVTVRRFPLPLHHASFYTCIRASLPDLVACRGSVSV